MILFSNIKSGLFVIFVFGLLSCAEEEKNYVSKDGKNAEHIERRSQYVDKKDLNKKKVSINERWQGHISDRTVKFRQIIESPTVISESLDSAIQSASKHVDRKAVDLERKNAIKACRIKRDAAEFEQTVLQKMDDIRSAGVELLTSFFQLKDTLEQIPADIDLVEEGVKTYNQKVVEILKRSQDDTMPSVVELMTDMKNYYMGFKNIDITKEDLLNDQLSEKLDEYLDVSIEEFSSRRSQTEQELEQNVDELDSGARDLESLRDSFISPNVQAKLSDLVKQDKTQAQIMVDVRDFIVMELEYRVKLFVKAKILKFIDRLREIYYADFDRKRERYQTSLYREYVECSSALNK